MNVKESVSDVRETYLMVQMTEDEKKAVRDAAKAMGLTMASFARMALKEFIKNNV